MVKEKVLRSSGAGVRCVPGTQQECPSAQSRGTRWEVGGNERAGCGAGAWENAEDQMGPSRAFSEGCLQSDWKMRFLTV